MLAALRQSRLFRRLLGSPNNGRWRIAPAEQPTRVTRRYWPGTLILETLFETAAGSVALIDFMAVEKTSLVRIVEGRSGSVEMQLDLSLRFEYGSAVPWVTRLNHGSGIRAIVGPDQVVLHSDIKLHGRAMTTVASFTAEAGKRTRFVLTHAASHLPHAGAAGRRPGVGRDRRSLDRHGSGAAPIADHIRPRCSARC